ncbi:MAG: hypothetical protein MUP22_15060 [Desulfobacterales bacterium]|nr:hypothetical protein [Desulfobacterales bacterium]
MNRLSVISIIIGIFAIVFRAPFIFAPEAAMRYFSEKVASNNNGIRLFGLFLLVLGIAMIFAAWESGLVIGKIIVIWGLFIAFISIVLMLIFPGAYGQILNYFSTVDSSVLRGIGVLGVAIGAIFLYFGLVVLWN